MGSQQSGRRASQRLGAAAPRAHAPTTPARASARHSGLTRATPRNPVVKTVKAGRLRFPVNPRLLPSSGFRQRLQTLYRLVLRLMGALQKRLFLFRECDHTGD